MDYATEQAAIERRRRIAEALMQQGAEPLQTNQIAGGQVIPVSPLSAVAKVAQQLAGAYIGRKADERGAKLESERLQGLGGLDFSAPDAPAKLAAMGMGKEAVMLAMQRAKQTGGESGTPGQWFIPAGSTPFKDPETGIVGYKTRDGAIIPSRAAMTDYQTVMTDPAHRAAMRQAEESERVVKAVDPEGSEYYAPTKALTGALPPIIPNQIMVESGGDVNAVSNKGARGATQIMPATAQDPGFGVEPMRDNSPDEQIRFQADYMRALTKHYGGDVKKALAAYNAGPGNVDRNGITNQGYVDKVLNQQPVKGPSLREKEIVEAEGAAAKKAAEMQAQSMIEAQRELPRVADDTLQSLELIDSVLQNPNLERVTGVMGKFPNMPGSPAADLQASIDAIKSKNYMAGFDQLRGAGAISEAEGKAAQAAYANLDQNVSAEKFRETLKTLKGIKDRALQRLTQKAGATVPEQKPQPAIKFLGFE